MDRIERDIDNLNTIASSTYKTYTKRNSAISEQIALVQQQIEDQQKAYDRYIQQANSVNLSSTYKNLVQNGAIDIEHITDEDLADNIDLYTEWWSFMPVQSVMVILYLSNCWDTLKVIEPQYNDERRASAMAAKAEKINYMEYGASLRSA